MTVLHFNNTVQRETCSYYRQRSLVVRLHPRHIEIREKGRRDSITVDYQTLYEFSLKKRFLAQQAENKAAKKVRKSA